MSPYPTLLELSAIKRYQSRTRHSGVPLRGFVTSLLQLQFYEALLFFLALHVHSLRFQRSLDRHRLHSAEKLSGNRDIDTRLAETTQRGSPSDRLGRSQR